MMLCDLSTDNADYLKLCPDGLFRATFAWLSRRFASQRHRRKSSCEWHDNDNAADSARDGYSHDWNLN